VLTFSGDLTGVVLNIQLRETEDGANLIDEEMLNLGPAISGNETTTGFALSLSSNDTALLTANGTHPFRVCDPAGVVAARGEAYVAAGWS
jgi:hypothetical protein